MIQIICAPALRRGNIQSARHDNRPHEDREDLDTLSDAVGLMPRKFWADRYRRLLEGQRSD